MREQSETLMKCADNWNAHNHNFYGNSRDMQGKKAKGTTIKWR